MNYDQLVVGYHGTSRRTAEALIRGATFKASENEVDWLGRGIYFWERGHDRALRWAREHHEKDPAVVGALIQLGDCYDLMDTRYTAELAEAARGFHAGLAPDIAAPQNRGKARYLDCAVLNWWLDQLDAGGRVFQTVRCGFEEGEPVHPGMAIRHESHVQIAVRDPRCIIGVFRPSAPTSRSRRTRG